MSDKDNVPEESDFGIMPEKGDFAEIQKLYGELPQDATEAQQAERYRLAQAARLIREHVDTPVIINGRMSIAPTPCGQVRMLRHTVAFMDRFDLEGLAIQYNAFADVPGYDLPHIDAFSNQQAAKAALLRLLTRLYELAAEDVIIESDLLEISGSESRPLTEEK